jgi:hypothetical protein
MRKTWDVEIFANLVMAAFMATEFDFGLQRIPYAVFFLVNALMMWSANPIKKRRTAE